MELLNNIIKDNRIKERIKRKEYEEKKTVLSDSDFKKYYYYNSDSSAYYRFVYPNENEISILLLHNMNKSLKNIKYWVWFFGILAIVSVISSIILYINLSKLFH